MENSIWLLFAIGNLAAFFTTKSKMWKVAHFFIIVLCIYQIVEG